MSESESISSSETEQEETPTTKSSIITDIPFSSLKDRVSDATLEAIEEMGFSRMTELQVKTIKPLLEVYPLYLYCTLD
jgi:ATP-dependent RNA helicase DDX18/HAS1